MSDSMSFETPMMKQYNDIKSDYPDAILLFRLGDFYEMFLEDAKIGSRVLGITLTGRDKGKDGKIPMCGVPYHAAEGYITKLVKAGYKVAICEQTTVPTKGKSIVEREVVRVVTPSMLLNETAEASTQDLLLTTHVLRNVLGISLVSIQSGDVYVSSEPLSKKRDPISIIEEYVSRYRPAEVLLPRSWYEDPEIISRIRRLGTSPFVYDAPHTKITAAAQVVKQYYKVMTLESFGLKDQPAAIIALSVALSYVTQTQKQKSAFLRSPMHATSKDYMQLSGQTIRNLELFSSARSSDPSTSLFAALDNTHTVMGKRLLSTWITRPLLSVDVLKKRHDTVSYFSQNNDSVEVVREHLSRVHDIERSVSRLSVGVGSARDGVSIRTSLCEATEMKDKLRNMSKLPHLVESFVKRGYWSTVTDLYELLSHSLADEPPAIISDGGMIRDGYNQRLDELRAIRRGGTDTLKKIENRERERTGISTLKVKFNKVFGYYIEVSKANIDKVPEDFIRRQTLTNAERYIIPELKEYEDTVLNADAQIITLELELFTRVVEMLLDNIGVLQELSRDLSVLDVLSGFGDTACQFSYGRPDFVDSDELTIIGGRHPVVERIVSSGFVPNDISLSSEHERMMILTGANMAGKSTYIRQVALIVIMAQVGSFVPAEKAVMGIVDQIHTRIGAMDNVAEGLSTFMVEMVETAYILHNLTDRSLVILDEVGRGTSTQDGLAIAWAITEFLEKQSKAKVLFATHYLELSALARTFDRIGCYHMAVGVTPREKGDDVVFLYRVKEGEATRSYGVQVARHAGIPSDVIQRAEELFTDIHERSKLLTPQDKVQPTLF